MSGPAHLGAPDETTTAKGQTTYVDAIREGLREEMARDPRVFLIGEDIGVYGGAFKVTEGLRDRFGDERVIDTPISESAIVGAAYLSEKKGKKPVSIEEFKAFARDIAARYPNDPQGADDALVDALLSAVREK